jgi:hypothetical protein
MTDMTTKTKSQAVKMIRVCMISYYGPLETLGIAAESLKKNDIMMYDFPLFRMMKETNQYVDLLIKYIKDNEITHVLWWFINIPTNEFIKIKQETRPTKFIFFNWDEPYNWKTCDIEKKMPSIDYACVTCQETLDTYRSNGCMAECLYPGFSPDVNYMINDFCSEDHEKYSCDISICCTNLYESESLYPDQYINRKKIIDNVYENQKKYGYTFFIYGPMELNKHYPDSYKGFIKYDKLNYVFNYSKINLCTHVLCNKYGYLNERIILIGASGGLCFVDNVNGITDTFTPNEHIIIMNKSKYIEQIVDILADYNKYVDIRYKMNDLCNKRYSYDEWGKSMAHVIQNTL